MNFVTSPERERIFSAKGHILVTGGPGCGKTTVALRKAFLRIGEEMLPGQKVLFLSFSRSAVSRIAQAARSDLPKESRLYLEIQTFHSFCWHLVRGHGYLLGPAVPIRLLPPHEERAMRQGAKDDDPEWNAERERLFLEKGLIAFNLFAPEALAILQGSAAHRKLIADRYPLIIVDEAQDTGTEQWECVKLLAKQTQLVCLADLDQQIYDFRHDVSPERLKHIMTALAPLEIDLGFQNNRSPSVEIIKFGNDILSHSPRGAPYKGVSQQSFTPDPTSRSKWIRAAIGIICKRITELTGAPPTSIGYLTNWGKGVTIIARALQGGNGKREVPHRVIMDEVEVLLATRVIALCMEPIVDIWSTLAVGLDLIAELYRARGNAKQAIKLDRYAIDARDRHIRGNAKCPQSLKAISDQLQLNPLSGNPGDDWRAIQHQFEGSSVTELELVARQVIYLIGFNRGRRIFDALADVWLQRGRYEGARAIIEKAITEDQIIGSDGYLTGINVMTMHKSKGKEFDGVVILHLGNNVSPLSPDHEPAPNMKSRRLVRVAITRAKYHVLMLTDAYSPSPLLTGHCL